MRLSIGAFNKRKTANSTNESETPQHKNVYIMRRSGDDHADKVKLLREAFQREYGITVSQFSFSYGSHGKPYLKNLPYFNISHSGDYIVCAMDAWEIGIDIQRVKKIHEGVMKRFLRSRAQTPKRQTLLWTRYESYAKMLGTGIPLEYEDWKVGHFSSAYLDGNYVITVCSEADLPQELRVIEID